VALSATLLELSRGLSADEASIAELEGAALLDVTDTVGLTNEDVVLVLVVLQHVRRRRQTQGLTHVAEISITGFGTDLAFLLLL